MTLSWAGLLQKEPEMPLSVLTSLSCGLGTPLQTPLLLLREGHLRKSLGSRVQAHGPRPLLCSPAGCQRQTARDTALAASSITL